MARPGKSKSRMKGRKNSPKSHTGAAPRRPNGLSRQDGRPDIGHKFTMQQEALNTEGRSIWRTGLQLRHKTVNFVSAGDMDMDDENQAHEHKVEEVFERPTQQPTPPQISTDQLDHRDTDETPLSVDMLREGIASADISEPTPDKVSFDDESSEDEIVFLGRHRRLEQRESHPDTHITSTRSSSIQLEIDSKHAAQRTTTPKTPQQVTPTSKNDRSDIAYPGWKDSSTEETDFISLKIPPKHTRHCQEDDDDDGFLADYIANMDDDYFDFGNTVSSDEEIDAYVNHPESAEKTGSQTQRIKSDSSLIGMLAAQVTNETEGQINREKGHHEKCSRASENPGTETLTGEESASELGEGDSEEEYDSQTIESIIRELEESTSRTQRTHNRPKGKMFASATAFANSLESDPYYGFDVMDFGRPSLRRKKKGKHSTLDLALSDSDLEMELEKAWRNDREKKSSRKRQREYLRSNGLLGRGLDDPDLKSKYPSTSMSFDDLNDEICKFLLSSKNSLPLPPMAKQRRKVVHDLAHDLCLNSQSRGKGSNRFTILHKTSRTVTYTQKTIDQAARVFSKGKFKHGGAKMWDQHVKKSPKVRSGRPDGNVSYMDGDVVGASAPEIGAGNKGRAMLEKMGWSTGTALGAANNKGILQPVAQVVKNSKAGLG